MGGLRARQRAGQARPFFLVRVVADSHALVWYVAQSRHLSDRAREVLENAESSDGVVISVASLVDLWYVSQTTAAVSAEEIARIRTVLDGAPTVQLHPIDEAVTISFTKISRALLTDPWDRFIVATARSLGLALVTRDSAIQKSGLVETIW